VLDLEIVNFLRWMIQMGVTQYCTAVHVKYGSLKIGRTGDSGYAYGSCKC